MNKKAFTMIELLAVVLILGVVLAIAVTSYNGYLNTSRDKSFKLAINSLRDIVEEAYIDCSSNNPNNDFCLNHKRPTTNSDKIYLYELINSGYSEKVKNPYDTNSECDSNSYIEVSPVSFNNGVSEYSYNVCLICGDKYSDGCN